MNSTKFLIGLVIVLLIAVLGMQYAQMRSGKDDTDKKDVAEVAEDAETEEKKDEAAGQGILPPMPEHEAAAMDALMQAEMEQLRAQLALRDGAIEELENEVAITSEQKQQMEVELRRNEREHQQRLQTIVDAPRLSTVKSVFPDQGFIVIGAGSSKNVQPGNEFSIRRGDRILARVIVTDEVAEEEAAAEVVPGSQIKHDDQSNQFVQIEPGDHVVQLYED